MMVAFEMMFKGGVEFYNVEYCVVYVDGSERVVLLYVEVVCDGVGCAILVCGIV